MPLNTIGIWSRHKPRHGHTAHLLADSSSERRQALEDPPVASPIAEVLVSSLSFLRFQPSNAYQLASDAAGQDVTHMTTGNIRGKKRPDLGPHLGDHGVRPIGKPQALGKVATKPLVAEATKRNNSSTATVTGFLCQGNFNKSKLKPQNPNRASHTYMRRSLPVLS